LPEVVHNREGVSPVPPLPLSHSVGLHKKKEHIVNKGSSSSNYWKKLGIFAFVGVIALFLCFCITVIFSSFSRYSPTPTINNQVPDNRQSGTISKTIPTSTALPSVTITPDMLSCGIIDAVLNDYLDRLTWDQYHLEGGEVDLYIKSLYGKKISFRGVVDDVIVNVFIYDDSCQNRISLSGIPDNESILLNKGSTISGYGTVGNFDPIQIINVDVESYQVVK
jgi:hypothetical protein